MPHETIVCHEGEYAAKGRLCAVEGEYVYVPIRTDMDIGFDRANSIHGARG